MAGARAGAASRTLLNCAAAPKAPRGARAFSAWRGPRTARGAAFPCPETGFAVDLPPAWGTLEHWSDGHFGGTPNRAFVATTAEVPLFLCRFILRRFNQPADPCRV